MAGSTTKNGYSYKISITGEEAFDGKILSGASTMQVGVVNPPLLSATKCYSNQLGRISKYNMWAFRKIVEPRYDELGRRTGVPVNFPELVQEHHMISILRSVEPLFYNTPKGMIQNWVTSPSVKVDKK